MPLATLRCLTFVGIQPIPVTIEVHLSAGLPAFAIVGLPDAEIRESRERVRSALLNSGFEFPSQRITVNLAPADLPKGSASFDLAIALGIAKATGQLNDAELEDWVFSGELSLSGQIVASRSPFAVAVATRKLNTCSAQDPDKPRLKLMLPKNEAVQVAYVPDLAIYGCHSLLEAASHLVGYGEGLIPEKNQSKSWAEQIGTPPDLAEVIGHESAKHALLVAAAGHHHTRLVGPPGSGKSMLAQRFSGLLPELAFEDALEISAINSLKNEDHTLRTTRPFRNPHPGSSSAALIGGGNPPKPGEITLAHQGVLFTDEVLEFKRQTLEALREPLESGLVNISRSGRQACFPARFLWLCAHNPCPCGWRGHPQKECLCTPDQVRRYQSRLSGPLCDRLDISIEVNPVPANVLLNAPSKSQTSNLMRQQVELARIRQLERQGCLNGEMSAALVQKHCKPDQDAEKLLLTYVEKNHLSSRAMHRISKVARTVADLDGSATVFKPHLAAAIQLRKGLSQLA